LEPAAGGFRKPGEIIIHAFWGSGVLAFHPGNATTYTSA
jgi:hypothetical protein